MTQVFRNNLNKEIQNRANISKCMKRPLNQLKLTIERIHFESADCLLTVFLISNTTIHGLSVYVCQCAKRGERIKTYIRFFMDCESIQ